MTKTKQQIRDEEAEDNWTKLCNNNAISTEFMVKHSFKAGWDCAFNESEKDTRVKNEALKIAVEALERIEPEHHTTTRVVLRLIAREALAEIKKIVGEL